MTVNALWRNVLQTGLCAFLAAVSVDLLHPLVKLCDEQLLTEILPQTEANSSLNLGPYASSPPYYPSPWIEGTGEWASAYARAQDFVRQLTLLEKVNLTTGTGWESEACVGRVLRYT